MEMGIRYKIEPRWCEEEMKRLLNQDKTTELFFLTICASLSCLISIFFIFKNPIILGDASYYLDVANNLAMGEGFVLNKAAFDSKTLLRPLSEWMPLYPLLIALFIKTGIAPTRAARLIPLIFLFLIPFCTYYFTKYLYGKNLAIISTIFLTLSPHLSIQASRPLTETMFALFIILTFLFLSKVIIDNKGNYFLFFSGIFAGLAYVTKGDGLLAIIAASFCIFYLLSEKIQVKVKRVMVLMAGFIASSGFWLTRNYMIFGSPFYYGQFGFRIPSFEAFTRILGITFCALFPLILFIPYSIAIYVNNTNMERKKLLFLLALPFVTVLFFTCWAEQSERLLLPAFLFLIILSTRSLCALGEKLKKKTTRWKALLSAITIIIVMAQLSISYDYYRGEQPQKIDDEWVEWIMSNTYPPDVILTNGAEYVRYYTGRYCVAVDTFPVHMEDIQHLNPFSLNLTKVKYTINYYKELYAIVEAGAIVHLNLSTLSMAVENLNVSYIVLFKEKADSLNQNGEFIYNLSKQIDVPNNLKLTYDSREVVIYEINRDKIIF